MGACGIRCCICRRWQSQVALMLVAGDGAICSGCIAICAEEIAVAVAALPRDPDSVPPPIGVREPAGPVTCSGLLP